MLFLILDGSDAWMLRATHVVWVLVVTVVGWDGQSTDWAGLTWAGLGTISEHSHLLDMLESIP